MTTLFRLRLAAAAAAGLACAPTLADPSAIDTVSAFVDAYNEHDSEKMLQYAANSVRWMSINGDKINVEAEGRKSLASFMDGYFDSLPSTRSELHGVQSLGPFVSMIEEAHWERDGKPGSQCAQVVYELSDGLIHNVWYFPAQPCEPRADAAP